MRRPTVRFTCLEREIYTSCNVQNFFIWQWKFGTINKDGSATGVNGCNALNNPDYMINIPVSNVFYDPPVPAIGYVSLAPPPAALMATNITIDLYEIQQVVLLVQSK